MKITSYRRHEFAREGTLMNPTSRNFKRRAAGGEKRRPPGENKEEGLKGEPGGEGKGGNSIATGRLSA